ncbi:MAG: hypothetical protein KIT86_00655 [Hydrogenophaga sp.]|uniref:hypothetical protein n=1 Tax=Hydrogenophaga sp. TaxID=1904254 RepID=UPI0026068637|nr:hypothetical protein [Hydrogenophaga sp.]MCW5668136.1 hypothetical protein [Hydrogenophaga sp.]
MGGGGGGDSTTVQNIPEELKPLASAYASKAINMSNQGFTPYTGERFAELNPTQMQGIDAITQRATQGSQTINNAEAALNQNIQGGQTNPYLDQMVGKAQDSVRSQFNTGAVNSGSFGNSGLQEQFQKGLGDVATSMYGQAYDQDKQRQMQSIGMAQQFGNQAYQDAGQLLNAGQIQQDQAQQQKDFGYQQFQEQQNLPYKQLAAMSGAFSGAPGQSTTTSSTGGGK